MIHSVIQNVFVNIFSPLKKKFARNNVQNLFKLKMEEYGPQTLVVSYLWL